mgnify:CR=1 FL=1
MFRRTLASLALLTLTFSLTACHRGPQALPVTPALQSQAALPPGYTPPGSKPCYNTSLSTQAALPPGYQPPTNKPCGCSQTQSGDLQSQAALPPGYNNPPGSPSYPKPGC